jgi:hypothetical protein
MSIHNTIRIIRRVEKIVSNLKTKYTHTEASRDLNKLSKSINELVIYLEKLDHLKPNFTTNEIESLMAPINLDLDILKSELAAEDFTALNNGMKVVKKALKFHPAKYSFFEFVVLWIYEFIYFI